MEIFKLIDILGTAAFAISGVFAAVEKKLDLFGIFIIAFITAMGGGTLRDILIGNLPVSWMLRPEYGLVIFTSALIAILFANYMKHFQNTLLLFDAVGLGFFTILGLHKGLLLGLHPGICIALGTITGCFGGVIRDILLNRIPLIFRKEIYATASIAGGLLYFLLLKVNLSGTITDVACILVVVFIRLIAVKNNWSLPGIYNKRQD
jgi:uncharacterized membrane protein YeiH